MADLQVIQVMADKFLADLRNQIIKISWWRHAPISPRSNHYIFSHLFTVNGHFRTSAVPSIKIWLYHPCDDSLTVPSPVSI